MNVDQSVLVAVELLTVLFVNNAVIGAAVNVDESEMMAVELLKAVSTTSSGVASVAVLTLVYCCHELLLIFHSPTFTACRIVRHAAQSSPAVSHQMTLINEVAGVIARGSSVSPMSPVVQKKSGPL